MHKPVDMFDQELKAGDIIIYGVRDSTSVNQRFGIVIESVYNNDHYYHKYALKIIAFNSHYYGRNPDTGKYEYSTRIYKTTLTSNTALIKVNVSVLPTAIKAIVADAIKRVLYEDN